MTTSLRLRAATLTLAAAATAAVFAAPAQAAPAMYAPCAKYQTAYQDAHQRAVDYYAQYRHSTGAARTKAYQLYVDWTTKADKAEKAYDNCVHNG